MALIVGRETGLNRCDDLLCLGRGQTIEEGQGEGATCYGVGYWKQDMLRGRA